MKCETCGRELTEEFGLHGHFCGTHEEFVEMYLSRILLTLLEIKHNK